MTNLLYTSRTTATSMSVMIEGEKNGIRGRTFFANKSLIRMYFFLLRDGESDLDDLCFVFLVFLDFLPL